MTTSPPPERDAGTTDPDWTLLLTRLPPEPDRARLGLWRELRRIGAVPVGAGAWVLPAEPAFLQGLDAVTRLAERSGGSIAALDVAPRDTGAAEVLRAAFAEVRRDEWRELIDDCRKLEAELDSEFEREKFTLGELEEEEQSLERLQRWQATLRQRDVLGLPEAGTAGEAVTRCEHRLAEYAERVSLESSRPRAASPLDPVPPPA